MFSCSNSRVMFENAGVQGVEPPSGELLQLSEIIGEDEEQYLDQDILFSTEDGSKLVYSRN
jgi:hypothetical protein